MGVVIRYTSREKISKRVNCVKYQSKMYQIKCIGQTGAFLININQSDWNSVMNFSNDNKIGILKEAIHYITKRKS